MRKQFFITFGSAIAAIIVLSLAMIYGFPYAISPPHIRNPQVDHPHMRMQVLVNGQAVNFGEAKFQESKPDICTETIPETPIHFHDGLDQFVHIHWRGITGGEVLKYYGWNYIGGSNEVLGYRFDTGAIPSKVPIHGHVLPDAPTGANLYVYVGDETGYQQKSLDDFLHKSLTDFFGVQSNFGKSSALPLRLSDFMYAKAYAHGGEVHAAIPGQPTEEELSRINDLLGNVVIFAQPNPPTDQQIKARFNMLVPLQDSTCGG